MTTAKREGTLLVSPPVYAESLAHPFYAEPQIMHFYARSGIVIDFPLPETVWTEAGRRYAMFAARKRTQSMEGPRRILADFVIGAHVLLQCNRLMTLDAAFYRRHFPELRLYPIGE